MMADLPAMLPEPQGARAAAAGQESVPKTAAH